MLKAELIFSTPCWKQLQHIFATNKIVDDIHLIACWPIFLHYRELPLLKWNE